jgi:hypothetical protein
MKRFEKVVHGALAAIAASTTACIDDPADDDLATATLEAQLQEGPTPAADDAQASASGGGSGGGFIDACQLPDMTRVTFNPTGSFDATDEGVSAPLSLPFAFTLRNTAHTRFWITTNGQLGFGTAPGGSMFGHVTCPLPDSAFATPILLAYSVDLVGRLDGDAGVCYATTGTAPNRKLVVTWKDSFFYEAWLTSHVTFSATLNEGTNVVDVALDRIDAPALPTFESGYATAVGLQSGNTTQTYSCFQPRAAAGTVAHLHL